MSLQGLNPAGAAKTGKSGGGERWCTPASRGSVQICSHGHGHPLPRWPRSSVHLA